MFNRDCSAASGVIEWLDCHSGIASWLQAVGAIAALLAIGTPILLDQIHARRERGRPIKTLYVLATSARSLLGDALGRGGEAANDSRLDGLRPQKWLTLEQAAASLPLSLMERDNQVKLTLRLLGFLKSTLADCTKLMARVENETTVDIEKICQKLEFNMEEINLLIVDIGLEMREH